MTKRVAYVVVAVFFVGLLTLAVFTIVSVGNLNSEVEQLEGTASALQGETHELKKTAAGEAVAALRKSEQSLKQTTSKLRKVEECLPEIQTEINSLGLERYGEEFFVESNSQVSSYCSSVVYGPPGE